MTTSTVKSEPSGLPSPLVSGDRWPEYIEWASDGGYDESYFNRWDSKSVALQETFLLETAEAGA